MKSQSIFKKKSADKFTFILLYELTTNTKLFEYMAHISDFQHVKFYLKKFTPFFLETMI